MFLELVKWYCIKIELLEPLQQGPYSKSRGRRQKKLHSNGDPTQSPTLRRPLLFPLRPLLPRSGREPLLARALSFSPPARLSFSRASVSRSSAPPPKPTNCRIGSIQGCGEQIHCAMAVQVAGGKGSRATRRCSTHPTAVAARRRTCAPTTTPRRPRRSSIDATSLCRPAAIWISQP